MAKADFKKALSTNSKREYRKAVKNEVIGKEAGEYVARSVTVTILKHQYSKPTTTGKGLENSNAIFSKTWLDNQLTFHRTGGTRKRISGDYDKTTGIYEFNWHTDAVFNDTRGTDLNAVENDSRRFINKGIQWAKDNVEGYQPPSDEQVGGHIEAQAFLQKLRKAVAYGVISEAEARDIRHAFMTGGMGAAMAKIGAKGSTSTGDTVKDEKLDQGFINIEENSTLATVIDTLHENINELDTKFGIFREVMLSIPRGMNEAQRKGYEDAQVRRLDSWLDKLADERLYDQPLSPSLEKMHQEIIAAALLGKISPKYKANYSLKQRSTPQKKKKTFRLPKTKRTATRAARAKFFTQLRASATQNPTSLMALINTKLQRELIDNMGQPALENITGRFANSVRVLKVTESKAGKSIQYTYDRDPYGVFEEDRARDPRRLIDRTIREIAAELIMGKFTTQRL